MVASAAVTALVALAIWLVVRDDPVGARLRELLRRATAHGAGRLDAARSCARCFGYRNTWLLLLIPGRVLGDDPRRSRASGACPSS